MKINRYSKKFKNLKLQQKIIIATILCIIFSTGFLGFFAYKLSTGIIERNAYKQTNETIQSSAKYMDEKMKSVLVDVNSMLINENFKNAVIKVAIDGTFNESVEFSKVERIISQLRVTNRLIDSVYVVTPRIIFYDTTKLLISKEAIIKTSIYQRFKKNRLISWGLVGEAGWLNERESVIPILISMSVGPEVAVSIEPANVFVIVHLKEYNLIQELSELRNRFAAETYLVTPEGRIITHSYEARYQEIFKDQKVMDNFSQEDSKFFYSHIKGEKILINYAALSVNGWRIVTVTPVEQLLGDVRYIQWLTLIAGILCTGFVIYVSIIISKTITKPLSKLQSIMGRIQNREFSARFEPKYDDEVGELGKSFNIMLDEIDLLISQLQDEQEKFQTEQKLKQIAELKALQSQINPHFLYNTLDSIYWKALTGGNEQVAEMVISLAEFFRLGLNKGKEEILIEQELRHVERYLFLQKSIYDGKFKYELTIDPLVSNYLILKFILQPLAENSLLHGFSEIKQDGMIQISAQKEENYIRLEVKDNGKGFDIGKIEQALQDEHSNKGGYALTNIHRRLKLRYGNEYRLEMSSEPYRETRISIWIPAIKEN